MTEKKDKKEPILGKDIPFKSIENKMCKVLEFNPFGKVENGKVLAPKISKPYASLTIERDNPSAIFELLIPHKIDFKHLWEAFVERPKNKNEEVVIFWSKNYKNRFLKPFSAILPKLRVMVYPKGSFEKFKNPEWRNQFKGEAGFHKELEELQPITEWKPDIIEWHF